MEYNPVCTALGLAPSTNCTKSIRLPEAGAVATVGHFEKMVNFLQLWSSCICGCKMQGDSLRHSKVVFFAEQKINIKWRRRRKKN